jgi:hypothetical protein
MTAPSIPAQNKNASTVAAAEAFPHEPTTPILNFPKSLRQERRWLAWKLDADKKTPISPVTGSFASSNDPNTWASFDDAHAYATANGLGLGLAINNSLLDLTPLVAIDFDHVTAKGEPAPEWATDVFHELGSFTERSVSGTGFHTFVAGELPEGVKEIVGGAIEQDIHGGKQKVELFNQKMLVVTGDCLPGLTEIKPASTTKLVELGERAKAGFGRIKKPVASVSSLVLMDKVAERLALLESGESPSGDKSEDDFAYVALLAEQGLSDSEIDSRFRVSGRMREKWEREDYRDRTISKVRKAHAQKLSAGLSKPAEPAKIVNPDDWRGLFHTYDETINAPPLSFLIDGFLQEDGLTFFGGLAGHGKTLIMLNVVKSLLDGQPLFGHFPVVKPAKRVLYLVPESGLGPFVHRLKMFRLLDYVKDGRLFFRTMTANDQDATLSDPRILKAAEGADVFLDTAIRFAAGEENSASDNRAFAKMLFNLQAAGARCVVGAHHAPKGFENRESITLDNALRGSGDIGAMLATCWAVRQTDAETNRVYMKCVKGRDFQSCLPFEVEGRPWIDETGSFKMVCTPGSAGLAVSRVKDEKPGIRLARGLRAEGKTLDDIAEVLGVSLRTVERWSSGGKLGPQTDSSPTTAHSQKQEKQNPDHKNLSSSLEGSVGWDKNRTDISVNSMGFCRLSVSPEALSAEDGRVA